MTQQVAAVSKKKQKGQAVDAAFTQLGFQGKVLGREQIIALDGEVRKAGASLSSTRLARAVTGGNARLDGSAETRRYLSSRSWRDVPQSCFA